MKRYYVCTDSNGETIREEIKATSLKEAKDKALEVNREGCPEEDLPDNSLSIDAQLEQMGIWIEESENEKKIEEICDICNNELEHLPKHDVTLISGFESTLSMHEIIEGLACNKCFFERFAYCTRCDTYYDKFYVRSDNKCIWCIEQEDHVTTKIPKLTHRKH